MAESAASLDEFPLIMKVKWEIADVPWDSPFHFSHHLLNLHASSR